MVSRARAPKTLGMKDPVKRAYWLATAVAVLAFIASGMANLLRLEHVAHDMLRLGYPPYFMTVLGFWKVLGGLTVLLPRLPRLKEWAYAGMTFDLTGAAASRAATHDAPATIIAPLVILAFVLVSWRFRPARYPPETESG
jgi:uncharacterized membrane protein YphA (DoxX/SURF4 family)